MTFRRAPFLVLALLDLAVAACSPSFSPPLTSTHFGAPGRLDPDEGHVEATGTMWGSFGAGGSLPLPVNVDLRLEVRGDARVGTTDGEWALGTVGFRYTARDLTHREDPDGKGLYGDLEGGFGLGVGGESSADDVDDDGPFSHDTIGADWDRVAFGGYVGAGLGYRVWKPFAVFGRVRAQGSAAEGLPETVWATAVVGPDFRFGPVSLYLAAGWGGYWNTLDGVMGPLFDGGLAYRFETPW